MKCKVLFSIALSAAIGLARAQTTVTGSFMHDGKNRTYSFYVPASYVPGQAVPLVLNLHGTGTDGAYQAQHRDFRPIADTAGFIVVHPDGTFAPFTTERFWNYGNVLGSTVDDIGFLEALTDTIAAHYTIDPERMYSTGMSNGSFMCYYLACQSDRFAAVAGVTGSMSVGMYNACNPARPVPTMHIHGTSDPINPYAGNSTMKSVEEVTLFWANQNNCNTVPAITAVPNTDTGDGATAERYLYAGGVEGHTVELFKVTGGGHTWPGQYVATSNGNTCMDFDASIEIWRFFSQYRISGTTSVPTLAATELKVWPNPARDVVYIQAPDHIVTGVSVFDLQGRLVGKTAAANLESIDLSHLETGNYVIKVSGEGFEVVKKLMITGH